MTPVPDVILAAPAPDHVFRDIDATWCPEMVVIPAGAFVMGSSDEEAGRDLDEGPQHRVTIAAIRARPPFGDVRGVRLVLSADGSGEDCYHDSCKGAPADGSAWTTGDCSAQVLRGGSWSNGPAGLRAAGRGRAVPFYRLNLAGFRVARMLTP